MTVVCAFLVPGSPLHFLKPDNPPWADVRAGYDVAAKRLAAAKPDVIAIYSTQWIAVLDQLWQTKSHLQGLHVDENWYEYGDLPFDVMVDVALTEDCITTATAGGIRSKAVNYDHFPIDSGSIVASSLLDPNGTTPLLMTSNNLYHDGAVTAKLGHIVIDAANRQHKRIALIGVGGLSSGVFRQGIDITQDKLHSDDHDKANRKLLDLIAAGNKAAVDSYLSDYAATAKGDMGMKHLAWIFGGLGDHYKGADIIAYGPCYGSGAAVIDFKI